MPFYVRLGHRGFFFRAGTFLIGIFGSAVYWQASRRRGPHPPTGITGYRPSQECVILGPTPHATERSAGLAQAGSGRGTILAW